MPTIAILTQVLLLFLGMFLMIVVLLQRGRGGGLAGAFGGAGGQSAFGTKAGDVFTKITVVIAVAWVLVAGGSGFFLRAGAESRGGGLPSGILSTEEEASLGADGSTSDSFDFTKDELDGIGGETPAAGDSTEAGNDDAPADETTDAAPDDEASPETPEAEATETDETPE